jgi:hypothetical protein
MDELVHSGSDRQSKGIWVRVARRIRAPRGVRNERGQAILEYLLVLLIAFTFTHQVFFNSKFGFKSVLAKTMMRLGSFLEQNLKSGTKVGGNNGRLSLDPYAGTDRWSN